MFSNLVTSPEQSDAGILSDTPVLKSSAEAFKNSLHAALEEGLVYIIPPRGIYDRPRLGNTTQQTGAVFCGERSLQPCLDYACSV